MSLIPLKALNTVDFLPQFVGGVSFCACVQLLLPHCCSWCSCFPVPVNARFIIQRSFSLSALQNQSKSALLEQTCLPGLQQCQYIIIIHFTLSLYSQKFDSSPSPKINAFPIPQLVTSLSLASLIAIVYSILPSEDNEKTGNSEVIFKM